MKLPNDNVKAKAYRKVPDDYGGLFRIIPLSDSTLAEAKRAISQLEPGEIADAFVWTIDQTYRAEDVIALMNGAKIAGLPPRTHRDEWEEAGQIMGGLSELNRIRSSGILSPLQSGHHLFRSALTMSLICLSDLLTKMKISGHAVETNDERGATDLLDVISSARNAACHVTTKKVQVGPSQVRFAVSRGPDAGMMMHGIQLGCPFPDEVAVFFGETCVYLYRDLLAAHDLLCRHYGENGIATPSTKG